MSHKSLSKQFNSLLGQAEYQKEKGEIRIAGSDWILMGATTFRDLIKGVEKTLGSGAVVIWLEAGKHAGKEFAEALLRAGADPEEVSKLMAVFFTQGGWGKIQTDVNSAKKEAVIRIKNCATSRQIISNEPVCHFVRGFIAGVSNIMFNDRMECIETKCTAKGDVLCEFQVKGKCRNKVGYLETEDSKALLKRFVKSLSDIIILSTLMNNISLSSYDIVALIDKKFGLTISPGTIYSIVYSLERDGLIEGESAQRRRTYKLTPTGEEALKALMQSSRIFKNIIEIFDNE